MPTLKPTCSATAPEASGDAIGAFVDRLDRVLRTDGGGLRLVSAAKGQVRVRFTGMCVQCPMRRLTWEATVKPALLGLDAVAEAELDGCRISDEAAERVTGYFERARALREAAP